MPDNTIARLLVVDDDAHIISVVTEALAAEPYNVVCLRDPAEALQHLRNNPVDLVLTDLVMGQHTGVQVLDVTRELHPHATVILMTAHPTVETAINVLKRGAHDFLVKPFKLEHLRVTIRRGLAHQKVLRENMTLKSQVQFLSAANALSSNIDIDNYLKRVLTSCQTELSASAVSVIEMNPATRQIMRRLHIAENESLARVVLDTANLHEFADTRSSEPLVTVAEQSRTNGDSRTLSISMPIVVHDALHGVLNVIVVSRFGSITPGQVDALRILANSAGAAIINHQLYQDLQASYMETIRALTSAIEARDKYTGGHTDRVIVLARELARALGWGGSQIDDLTMGCTLHDIGKIAIPDSILNKEAALNDEERARMIRHPIDGMKIIANIDRLKPAIPYVLNHHERWDGKGYPRGLAGTEIPLEGRLLAVADTFDAILSDRPYRKGASVTRAIEEIERSYGTQFDPDIARVFVSMLRTGKINLRGLYGPDKDLSDIESPAVTQKVSA